MSFHSRKEALKTCGARESGMKMIKIWNEIHCGFKFEIKLRSPATTEHLLDEDLLGKDCGNLFNRSPHTKTNSYPFNSIQLILNGRTRRRVRIHKIRQHMRTELWKRWSIRRNFLFTFFGNTVFEMERKCEMRPLAVRSFNKSNQKIMRIMPFFQFLYRKGDSNRNWWAHSEGSLPGKAVVNLMIKLFTVKCDRISRERNLSRILVGRF